MMWYLGQDGAARRKEGRKKRREERKEEADLRRCDLRNLQFANVPFECFLFSTQWARWENYRLRFSVVRFSIFLVRLYHNGWHRLLEKARITQ